MNKKLLAQGRISLWARKAREHITNALETQLLMMVASMPFLLAWQLPFTPLSIIGNLIHPPFLITFLLLSLLLYIATIVGLPTKILVTLLSSTHHAWSMLLCWQPIIWWPRLTWWHFGISCALLVAYHAWHRHKKSATIIAALTALLLYVPIVFTPKTTTSTLIRDRFSLNCTLHADGSLILDDDGYISRAANTDAIMDYEVIPHLISTYGLPRKIILHAPRWGKRLSAAKLILDRYAHPLKVLHSIRN